MKITVEQSPECREVEVTVKYDVMDGRLGHLIEHIRVYSYSVAGEKDGVTRNVPLEEIYYFDSVDNKTFIYTKDQMYYCEMKLYELEEQLSDTPFVRISKNNILNSSMVVKVTALLNGRFEARLNNNEKVIVTKHYMKLFRTKFE